MTTIHPNPDPAPGMSTEVRLALIEQRMAGLEAGLGGIKKVLGWIGLTIGGSLLMAVLQLVLKNPVMLPPGVH